MSTVNNKFVFVVCGSREHMDTLHYSLRALNHFSRNEIIVLTDSKRNEIPVDWENIVDISTPEHFNNHQASIYLKTAIHRFLPEGPVYCYLDTDVIAFSEEVDTIFAQKHSIITFAPDHCRVKRFSPHAVNCGCLEENRRNLAELEKLQARYYNNKYSVTNPELKQKQKLLLQKLQVLRRKKWHYFLTAIRFLLTPAVFKLDEDNYYHRWKKYWTDVDGNAILYDRSKSVIHLIEKNSEWRYNPVKKRWINAHGKDVFVLECDHLKELINTKFGIELVDNNWQHWNGGVFIFDSDSQAFLESWHQKTMDIFTDPIWRTRDQGTLMATAWQFGLQNDPLLSKKYNFIADYYNPALMFNDGKTSISDDALINQYQPAFIHIYHHFGTKGWDVWDWVDNRLTAQLNITK